MNLYAYAGNNPVAFVDPFGLAASPACPPCIAVAVAAWGVYEVGSAAYDVYNAGKTLLDDEASGSAKLFAVGLAAVSVFGPGGGYSAAQKGATRVIGHYPDYVHLAEGVGARAFNIPTSIWDKMSEAERWAANTRFLDRGIREGSEFLLATPIDKVREGSALAREIRYLLENGYEIVEDGSKLVAQ